MGALAVIVQLPFVHVDGVRLTVPKSVTWLPACNEAVTDCVDGETYLGDRALDAVAIDAQAHHCAGRRFAYIARRAGRCIRKAGKYRPVLE